MFDIGWSEMAVIALVALIVIGPKELPNAMRAAAKWARKARSLAREFQSGVDEMIREAELEDARKALDTARDFKVDQAFEETVDPTGSLRKDVREIEESARRSEPAEPAEPAAEPAAEPGTSARAGAEAPTPEAAEKGGEGATVIRQPLEIAPAHSLRPPAEPANSRSDTAQQPGEASEAAADDDAAQKRA